MTALLVFGAILNVAILIGFFCLIKLVYNIKTEFSTKRPLSFLYEKYEKARLINQSEMSNILKEIFYMEWLDKKYAYGGTSEEFQEMLKEKYAKWLAEANMEIPKFKLGIHIKDEVKS
jgi:hypothetical protein